MKFIKIIFSVIVIFILALNLASCDDTTSTGGNGEKTEAPAVPSFNEMQMQTDAFSESNYSMKNIAGHHKQSKLIPDLFTGYLLENFWDENAQFDQFPSYTVASALVKTFEAIHQESNGLLSSYFTNWDKDNVELSNDEYIWNYDVEDPETEETFSLRVVAAVTGDEVNWSVIAELDSEEFSFEEQQIMDGVTSLDGSTGDWTVTLEIPEEAFSFESTNSWGFDGENLTEMDLDIAVTDDDVYVNAYGTYEMDNHTGRIHNAKIDAPELEEASENLPWDVDLSQPFNVEWNTETEDGSITIGEDSFCWDEDHNPVDC